MRISNDATQPVEKRRNYKGVVDAFQRIMREEGFKTFFSGSGPFVNRAMVVGAVQVGTYDQFRGMYKDMGVKNELLNVFYASMTSGLIYAIATMPLETAKNRMAFQVQLLDEDDLFEVVRRTLACGWWPINLARCNRSRCIIRTLTCSLSCRPFHYCFIL